MKKTNNRKEIIRQVKESLLNVWLFIVLGTLLLSFLLSNVLPASKTFNLIKLFILVFAASAYICNQVIKKEEHFFERAFYIIMIVALWFSFFTYFASSVNEPLTAISLLVLSFLAVLVAAVISGVSKLVQFRLYKRKHLSLFILGYLFASFALIALFSFIYAIASISPENHLKYVEGGNYVKEPWEFMYFSSSSYYSANYGDISPQGSIIKTLTQIEAAVSFVIHVILISSIISMLKNDSSEAEKLNKTKKKLTP